jgi:hypothetical protein
MFGEPLFSSSLKGRARPAQWWSEGLATFGLLVIVWRCLQQRLAAASVAIGAYIAAAYFHAS